MGERGFKYFKTYLVIVCLFAQLVKHKTNIRVIAILPNVFILKIGFKQILLPNLAFVLSTHQTSNGTHETIYNSFSFSLNQIRYSCYLIASFFSLEIYCLLQIFVRRKNKKKNNVQTQNKFLFEYISKIY